MIAINVKILGHHMKSHFRDMEPLQGDLIVKCGLCDYYGLWPDVDAHARTHAQTVSVKGHLLNIAVFPVLCDKRPLFLTKNANAKQLSPSSQQASHKCVLCDTHFATKAGYKKHLAQHMGEFPFPCTQCDKGFFDEFTLRDHLFAHQV